MLITIFKYASISAALAVGFYASFLGLLTTRFFQTHIVYLHKIQMTWGKDLDVPEVFGFLHNQATPFHIRTDEGAKLYAWHILPLGIYRRHESDLVAETSGFVMNFESRLAFRLLADDPDARLILHMHGAAGTVGSGYRVPNYRALSAGDPDKIHVLTFDYRGFGRSVGTPSEQGMIQDAIAVAGWAMKTAGIPPSRIIIFSQSIGTAVTLALSEHFAAQSPPVVFAGTILVAPFVDVATLVSTYSVAGTIPILGPVTKFPALFKYLSTFIQDKWSSKDRIATYFKLNEANSQRYRLTVIHAEDDWDIPFHHTEILFWHAINAVMSGGISYEEFEKLKEKSRTDLGAQGSVMEWRTENGVLREEILKYGLHDVVMGNPIVTMAVMRMIHSSVPFDS